MATLPARLVALLRLALEGHNRVGQVHGVGVGRQLDNIASGGSGARPRMRLRSFCERVPALVDCCQAGGRVAVRCCRIQGIELSVCHALDRVLVRDHVCTKLLAWRKGAPRKDRGRDDAADEEREHPASAAK